MKFIFSIFPILLALFISSTCLAQNPELANKYWNQASTLSKQGKYLEAAEMFVKSAEAEQASLNPRMKYLAVELNEAGLNYYKFRLLINAHQYYQQALEIYRRLGNEAGVSIVLNNIGIVYKSWSQYNKALEYYKQGLEIDRRIGNEANVSAKLNNIGLVYQSWSKYDKALEYYNQALEIDRRIGNEAKVPAKLNNIGLVYDSWSKYDKALEYYNQALEIDRRLGNEAGVSTLLCNIGKVYDSWSKYDKALEYYNQALEIDRRLGNEAGVSNLLNNIGLVYDSWSKYNKALEYYQQALEIDRRIGNEAEMAGILNNIGVVYNSWSKYDKALKYYQQGLEIARRLGNEAGVAALLNNIGKVYDSWSKYDKALEYYQQALEINRRISNEAGVAALLNNIGMVYKLLSKYDKAIEYYKQSINFLEKIRQTAQGDIRRDYLASQIHTYQALASAYLHQEEHAGLLDAIEQSRARLLAEKIAGIDAQIKIPTLTEVQKDLKTDEAVLIFSNIDHNKFILMVITADEVVSKEISKESFLAKSQKLYKDSILLLLEKQRGFEVNPKKGDAPFAGKDDEDKPAFEEAVNYYRTALIHPTGASKRGFDVKQKPTSNSTDSSRESGRLFYDLLIEPIQENLIGKTTLTIMPDGILGFLPFETLLNAENQYLVENFTLQYTQSLTISKMLNNRHYPSTRKPMLAMGGAKYAKQNKTAEVSDLLAWVTFEASRSMEKDESMRDSYARLGMGSWANLPGTLAEAKNIAAIISDAETIVGSNVTESTIKDYSKDGKLADYKVLHFATHGLVVPAIPELSAIVLSQFATERNNEDGYLRMAEIAELDIQADFVNLSACETGLGKIYGGEGIVGLTQSFLIAGANGLSVSLWQVADESTAKFMTELYKKTHNEGLGYRQAVTEIKRNFINGEYGEKWQSPYYWSPFIYYGK